MERPSGGGTQKTNGTCGRWGLMWWWGSRGGGRGLGSSRGVIRLGVVGVHGDVGGAWQVGSLV